MKNYAFLCNLLTFITFGALITGCATMPSVPPSSEQVVIKKYSIPKNCQLRGKVSYTQEMQSMNTDSQAAQYDRLKIQAAQLGANTVLLSPDAAASEQKHYHGKNKHEISQGLSSPPGMGEQKHYHGKNLHKITGLHYLSGNAYWCPTR